jgi:DNA-binding transcriptional ArsR family regulator
MAKLREAGVVTVRLEGTRRFISLRRGDLDTRFPGLLDSIAASSVDLPLPDAFLKDAEPGSSSSRAS